MGAPLVPHFPPAPTVKFVDDSKLQGAVKIAIDELTKARKKAPVFRLAIIDLGDESSTATLKFGHHNGNTVDFIASEAKIIALYGAFALRDLVERFAAAWRAVVPAPKPGMIPIASPDVFSALLVSLRQHILNAGDPRLAVIPEAKRLPDFKTMFDPPSAGSPHFAGTFINALHEMIVPSSNTAASTVIMSVGFAYLSGAMKAAGLQVGGKGPWLSADFAGNYYPLMSSTNDDAVGQAGTALTMAKLMAIIATQSVAFQRADAYKHMKKLLAKAVDGDDQPFLTRDTVRDPSDEDASKPPLRIPRHKITHIKLGWEKLKLTNGGHAVGSETFRLQGLYRPQKVYAVAFQNLNWHYTSSEDLAFAVRRAIAEYE